MSLTKEQLLIPRVLCIGGKDGEPNYPGSQFKVGQILTQCVFNGDEVFVHEDFSKPIYSSFALKFPHLFRPLKWWEHRKPEDMPVYLRGSGCNGDVFFKVLQWRLCTETLWQWVNSTDGDTFYLQQYCTYQPATEQEYLDYQKQKQ